MLGMVTLVAREENLEMVTGMVREMMVAGVLREEMVTYVVRE